MHVSFDKKIGLIDLAIAVDVSGSKYATQVDLKPPNPKILLYKKKREEPDSPSKSKKIKKQGKDSQEDTNGSEEPEAGISKT